MVHCMKFFKERDGNEMECLACMRHRVKRLVKTRRNDNGMLILNKIAKYH